MRQRSVTGAEAKAGSGLSFDNNGDAILGVCEGVWQLADLVQTSPRASKIG